MKNQNISLLNWFRVIALLEGLSFILLLFIAMPLKYWAGIPDWVRIIGMAHGVLFMIYVPLCFLVGLSLEWTWRKIVLAEMASLIPFGTFWAELKLFRK